MTDLRNPHDRFFKALFSQQAAARDFLYHYLPAEVVSLLDLTSLHIHKDSFIDPELQEHFSDLLYQVTLYSGHDLYIYLLFEHKSYPEPEIAFQLLRYQVRIWEQDRKQGRPFRPVLPLVLYHGRQTWTVPLDFAALFDLPDALSRYVPTFEYQLYDLSRYSDEEIRGEVILRVSLLLLKYILHDEFGQQFRGMVGLLQTLGQQVTGLEYLHTILRYVAGGTEKIERHEFIEVVQAIFETGDNPMPTLAEQWKQEGEAIGLEKGEAIGLKKGIEQGREEGIEQGREEGREEGLEQGREATLKLLRRFLAQRFAVSLDHFDAAWAVLDLAALDRLSEVAFTTGSLAEFEAQVQAEVEATDDHSTDD
ncbi:MAG: Rpn family recombination-promoting nuclease/putative transposase [Anaerolineaceae bacterium]|nr:Rpn family recombination-promoting nuclease/putative transposase [Anaerolineaceae bacterium]MCB9098123.1 Rpn family recombination-promoting nuclease/putative transposase [Anaerolineales bacterium]